jgi:hypothetical protein
MDTGHLKVHYKAQASGTAVFLLLPRSAPEEEDQRRPSDCIRPGVQEVLAGGTRLRLAG